MLTATSRKWPFPELDLTDIGSKFLWLFCFVVFLEGDRVAYERSGKVLGNDARLEPLHRDDDEGATAPPRATWLR